MSLLRFFPLLIITAFLLSCRGQHSADPCCRYLDPQPGTSSDDGYGQIRIEGSTSGYFRVTDMSGQQVATELINHAALLPAGRYLARINNAVCIAEVKAGQLANCSTGTLQVTGTTGDEFIVADSTGRQLASATMGKPLSLFPGIYSVSVNNTRARVTVKAKELTEVRTGTLLVLGDTDDSYHVLDGNNKQLNFNRLGKPLAFLPGVYPVKVNRTSMEAEIMPGRVTELATGSVLVTGLTEEYYYVSDTLGNALNYQALNRPLAFFPGNVQIRLNNSVVRGRIAAGETMEVSTGSIVLTGKGTEYFYILDEAGNSLHYNSLNRSLSLFPSGYIVKVGGSLRKTIVNAGKLTSMEAFDAPTEVVFQP